MDYDFYVKYEPYLAHGIWNKSSLYDTGEDWMNDYGLYFVIIGSGNG